MNNSLHGSGGSHADTSYKSCVSAISITLQWTVVEDLDRMAALAEAILSDQSEDRGRRAARIAGE